MMKRFLAMLLCLLICLSLFPAAALADGEAADSFAEETVGVSQPEDAAEAPTEETEDAVEVSVSDNDPGTPEEETPPVLPSESEEAQEPSEPAVGDAGTVPGAEMPDTEDHALGVPQEEFEDDLCLRRFHEDELRRLRLHDLCVSHAASLGREGPQP